MPDFTPHVSPSDPLVFRQPRWIRVSAVLATLLSGITAAVLWQTQPGTLLSWCVTGIAIIGIAGVATSTTQRVTLTSDSLEVRTLARRVSYPRATIERVAQERGSPPALLLSDGKWVRLFELDTRSIRQIRSWINEAPGPGASGAS